MGCSCQYALGGGAVAPGGSYPQAQIISSKCASQLHKYLVRVLTGLYDSKKVGAECVSQRNWAEGCCRKLCRAAHCFIETQCCLQVNQYDRDVETAIASARAYFDTYPQQANASQIIVLDIDETALSNRAEWLTALEAIKGGGIVPSSQVLLCPHNLHVSQPTVCTRIAHSPSLKCLNCVTYSSVALYIRRQLFMAERSPIHCCCDRAAPCLLALHSVIGANASLHAGPCPGASEGSHGARAAAHARPLHRIVHCRLQRHFYYWQVRTPPVLRVRSMRDH